MKAIDKAKELSRFFKELRKQDAHVLVNGKALYKPEFVLFCIERVEAEQFFELQSTVEVARNAIRND